VGEQHARAFLTQPECSLIALCDIDPLKLAAVGGRLPPTRRYSRAEDLIDDPDVNIVSIASYDDAHSSQIIRALRSGKHVFAEKPLCTTRGELREIRAALGQAVGMRLSTNTILRRSLRFRWLKKTIANGELGTLFSIEADYVYGRLKKLTEGWRGQIPGYSVVLGGGIHVVDLVLWVSGQRPVEAVAYGSGIASRGSRFKGNDLVLALLRFESGLVAKIGANFASVHPHFHRFLAYGTQGTFENSPDTGAGSGRLWFSRDPETPPTRIDEPYPGVGKGELIPGFVDAVRGRGEPDVSEDDVFAALSVCLSIDESVATGKPVIIKYE